MSTRFDMTCWPKALNHMTFLQQVMHLHCTQNVKITKPTYGKNALKADFEPCSADGHGWKKVDGVLDLHWMTRAPAPDSVLELVACKSCKNVTNADDHVRIKG